MHQSSRLHSCQCLEHCACLVLKDELHHDLFASITHNDDGYGLVDTQAREWWDNVFATLDFRGRIEHDGIMRVNLCTSALMFSAYQSVEAKNGGRKRITIIESSSVYIAVPAGGHLDNAPMAI